MRTLALLALILAIAACHEAPTSPYSRPSGPAPFGLPVVLGRTPSTGTPVAATIVADADSLVASAEFNYSGCFDYAAVAGTAGGSVVVTVVETAPYVPRACSLITQTAVYHAVVRPAPRGSYSVVLRERMEWPSDGPLEREWARRVVTLP